MAIRHFYHYFDASRGPFLNLSALSLEEGALVQNGFEDKAEWFASRRDGGYVKRRRELEALARDLFVEKGGKPRSDYPHYLVIEACAWLETWYPNPRHVAIPVEKCRLEAVSFSYGDLFPTFSGRVDDGKEYRRKIYRYDEILELIGKYGLPQEWNPDGTSGPERYIEVQYWDEGVKGLVP